VQVDPEVRDGDGGDVPAGDGHDFLTSAEPPAQAPPPAKEYPFSVVDVLATSLRVTRRNFVAFFVLSCVLEIPMMLVHLVDTRQDKLLALLVGMVAIALNIAVVTYGVIMELTGSRPSTRTCIKTGFDQIGSVLGVSLVSTLLIFGAALLLFVPGVIASLAYFVVVPVAVVERVGIGGALRRSRELTRDRKGDLFLLLALTAGLSVGITLVARNELTHDAALAWLAGTRPLARMFVSVMTAVAYVELRKLRDGLEVPELATAMARFRKSR